jgi:imidazolonepropionase-like amidohydrolase
MRVATGITHIFNGQLIDGTGAEPVRDAVVVVDDGRISYAGPAIRAPQLAIDVQQIDAQGGTIMPGLIESHFHATYYNVLHLEDLDIKYPPEMVA